MSGRMTPFACVYEYEHRSAAQPRGDQDQHALAHAREHTASSFAVAHTQGAESVGKLFV